MQADAPATHLPALIHLKLTPLAGAARCWSDARQPKSSRRSRGTAREGGEVEGRIFPALNCRGKEGPLDEL